MFVIFTKGGQGQHSCDSNNRANIIESKFVEINRERRKRSKVSLKWSYSDMLISMLCSFRRNHNINSIKIF